MQAVEILLSDARGIYIPANFVEGFDREQWELNDSSFDWAWETCQNPDNDMYWEAWEQILWYATYTKGEYVWKLCQDGDLFAVCPELMTDEEREGFGFED